MNDARALLFVALIAGVAACVRPAWGGPDAPTESPPDAGPAHAAATETSPWEGTRDRGTGAAAGGATNRIDIVFDPTQSSSATPCDRIEMIQTVQIFIDGDPVYPDEMGFSGRDAYAIDDPAGTHVDRWSPETETPYFGGDGADTATGSGAGTGHAHAGSSGNVDHPADIDDEPGGPLPAGANERKYEFETCAFCVDGPDWGDYFDCMTWEFVRTSAGGPPGESHKTGESAKPSAGFQKAVDKWVEGHNFPLPGK